MKVLKKIDERKRHGILDFKFDSLSIYCNIKFNNMDFVELKFLLTLYLVAMFVKLPTQINTMGIVDITSLSI